MKELLDSDRLNYLVWRFVFLRPPRSTPRRPLLCSSGEQAKQCRALPSYPRSRFGLLLLTPAVSSGTTDTCLKAVCALTSLFLSHSSPLSLTHSLKRCIISHSRSPSSPTLSHGSRWSTNHGLGAADYRETAAKFQKEWRVEAPHRHFDFAIHVKNYALVSVLNKGLIYQSLERDYALQRVSSPSLLSLSPSPSPAPFLCASRLSLHLGASRVLAPLSSLCFWPSRGLVAALTKFRAGTR